jgi:hypothetical protein
VTVGTSFWTEDGGGAGCLVEELELKDCSVTGQGDSIHVSEVSEYD